jgi:hypothetical protein
MLELLTISGKNIVNIDAAALVPEYLYVMVPEVYSPAMVPEYLYVMVPDTLSTAMVPEYLYTMETP